MAATGALKERIQLLQAAVARGEATGKTLKPELQAELDAYGKQGLLAGTGGTGGGGATAKGATTLRTEFQNLPEIKEFGTVRSARERVRAITQTTDPSAQDDIALIFSYMKLLDPTSVVREGEFATAQNATGVPSQVLNAYNKVISGNRLNADQRRGFAQSANQVYLSQRDIYNQKADYYRDLAKGDGINPDVVARRYIDDRDQPKGGDRDSGTAGAVAGSGGTPPSGPTSPDGAGGGSGQVQFNDEAPVASSNAYRFTPEQQAALQTLAQSGASADALKSLAIQFGGGLSDENAQGIAAFYANPNNRNVKAGFDYSKVDEVKPVDSGDGAAGAAARGAGNVLTVGLLDEAGALADTVTQGGTYDQNLDRRRGQELYDEREHGIARFAGQVVGGLPLGGVEFAGAREAARAAGLAAVRSGTPVAEARALANRVFATRTAAEASAQAGAYGFGNADGELTDRLGSGAAAALVGGTTGGVVAYGGGRFAQALAARRAARVAGRSASIDETMRNGLPTTEAGRLLALAQQQGVRVLPQDIADGPMIGRMTAGAAQSPFGTNTVRNATDDLYNSFSRRVGEIGGDAGAAPDIGGVVKARSAELAAREAQRADDTSQTVLDAAGTPDDLTGAGQVAQRGATRWMERTQERANQLYNAVPIAQEADAAIGNTRAALNDINQGMRSNPQLGALFANPRMQALERALTDEVNPDTGEVVTQARLNWQDLQRFRGYVGEALDNPQSLPGTEKTAQSQLRRLYGALSDDMRATAEAQGPQALRAWRRANDYADGRFKRINQTLNAVLGERRDRTANEAITSLNAMLRNSSTGNANRFSRVMRSIGPDDARVVRSTLVQEARGGRQFDAKELAANWDKLSERGKSALLPQQGLRHIMDDAADRAAASARDPLAAKSGQQVVAALEDMAKTRGDSVAFQRQLNALSPDEAHSVRALLINRMGLTKADAVRQGDGGEVFSISHFLNTWEKMTDEAKLALFGSGQMRSDMNALANLAKRVSKSESLRGHSNTGAINNLNATTGGLGAAAVALLTGHPIIATGLAAPAAYQRLSAEALTSQRLLNWLARAPKKPNLAAQRAHIRSLSSIARAEPAIASDVLSLQQRLATAFGDAPTRLAAQERSNESAPVQGQASNSQGANERLQP